MKSHATVRLNAGTISFCAPLHCDAIQVDAALDESNQALVATLIKVLFS